MKNTNLFELNKSNNKLNKPKIIQEELDKINLQYNINSFIIPHNNKLCIYIDSEDDICNDIKIIIDNILLSY